MGNQAKIQNNIAPQGPSFDGSHSGHGVSKRQEPVRALPSSTQGPRGLSAIELMGFLAASNIQKIVTDAQKLADEGKIPDAYTLLVSNKNAFIDSKIAKDDEGFKDICRQLIIKGIITHAQNLADSGKIKEAYEDLLNNKKYFNSFGLIKDGNEEGFKNLCRELLVKGITSHAQNIANSGKIREAYQNLEDNKKYFISFGLISREDDERYKDLCREILTKGIITHAQILANKGEIRDAYADLVEKKTYLISFGFIGAGEEEKFKNICRQIIEQGIKTHAQMLAKEGKIDESYQDLVDNKKYFISFGLISGEDDERFKDLCRGIITPGIISHAEKLAIEGKSQNAVQVIEKYRGILEPALKDGKSGVDKIIKRIKAQADLSNAGSLLAQGTNVDLQKIISENSEILLEMFKELGAPVNGQNIEEILTKSQKLVDDGKLNEAVDLVRDNQETLKGAIKIDEHINLLKARAKGWEVIKEAEKKAKENVSLKNIKAYLESKKDVLTKGGFKLDGVLKMFEMGFEKKEILAHAYDLVKKDKGKIENAIKYLEGKKTRLKELGVGDDDFAKIIESFRNQGEAKKIVEHAEEIVNKGGAYKEAEKYIDDNKSIIEKAYDISKVKGSLVIEKVKQLLKARKKDEAVKLLKDNEPVVKTVIKKSVDQIIKEIENGGTGIASEKILASVPVILSTSAERLMADSTHANRTTDPSLIDDTKLVVFFGAKKDKKDEQVVQQQAVVSFYNNGGRYGLINSDYSGAQVPEGLVRQTGTVDAKTTERIKKLQEALGVRQTGVMDEITLNQLATVQSEHPELFPKQAKSLDGAKIKPDYLLNKHTDTVQRTYGGDENLDDQVTALDLAWKISHGTIIDGAQALAGGNRKEIIEAAIGLLQAQSESARASRKPDKKTVETANKRIEDKEKELMREAGLSEAQLKPIKEKLEYFTLVAIAIQDGARTKQEIQKKVVEFYNRVHKGRKTLPDVDRFLPDAYESSDGSRSTAALGIEFKRMLTPHEREIWARYGKVRSKHSRATTKICKDLGIKYGDTLPESTASMRRLSNVQNVIKSASTNNLSDSEIALAQRLSVADIEKKSNLMLALSIAHSGTKRNDDDDSADKKKPEQINEEIHEAYNSSAGQKAFKDETKKRGPDFDPIMSVEISDELISNISRQKNAGPKTTNVPAPSAVPSSGERHKLDDLTREAPMAAIKLALVQAGYRGEVSGTGLTSDRHEVTGRRLYSVPREALYAQDIDAIIAVFSGKTYRLAFNTIDHNELNAIINLNKIEKLSEAEARVLNKVRLVCLNGANLPFKKSEIDILSRLAGSNNANINADTKALLKKLIRKNSNGKYIEFKPLKEGLGANEEAQITALRALARELRVKGNGACITSLDERDPIFRNGGRQRIVAALSLRDGDSYTGWDPALALDTLKRIAWQLSLNYMPAQDHKTESNGLLGGVSSMKEGIEESNVKTQNLVMLAGVDEQLVAYLKLLFKTVVVGGRQIIYGDRIRQLNSDIKSNKGQIDGLIKQAEEIPEIKQYLSKFSEKDKKLEALAKLLSTEDGHPKWMEIKNKLLPLLKKQAALELEASNLYQDIFDGRIDLALWNVLKTKEGIQRKTLAAQSADLVRYALGESVFDRVRDQNYRVVQEKLIDLVDAAFAQSGGDLSTKVNVGEAQGISKGKAALQVLLNNLGIAREKYRTDITLLAVSAFPMARRVAYPVMQAAGGTLAAAGQRLAAAGLWPSVGLGGASWLEPEGLRSPGMDADDAIDGGGSLGNIFDIINRNLNAGDMPDMALGSMLKMFVEEDKPIEALASSSAVSNGVSQPGNFRITRRNILKFAELLRKTQAQINMDAALRKGVEEKQNESDPKKKIQIKLDRWGELIGRIEAYAGSLNNNDQVELWSPQHYSKNPNDSDYPLYLVSQLLMDYMKIQEVMYKGVSGTSRDLTDMPFTSYDPDSVTKVTDKAVTVEHFYRSSGNVVVDIAESAYRLDGRIPTRHSLSPIPPLADYERDPVGLLRSSFVDSWGEYNATGENIIHDTVHTAAQTAFNWGLWVPFTINYHFAKAIFDGDLRAIGKTGTSFLMWELGVTPARMIIDELHKGNPVSAFSTLAVSAPILYSSLLTSVKAFGFYAGPGWEVVNGLKALDVVGRAAWMGLGRTDWENRGYQSRAGYIFEPFKKDFMNGNLMRRAMGLPVFERHGMISGGISDLVGGGINRAVGLFTRPDQVTHLRISESAPGAAAGPYIYDGETRSRTLDARHPLQEARRIWSEGQERTARGMAFQHLLNLENLDNRTGHFTIGGREVSLNGSGIRDLFRQVKVGGRVVSRLELAIQIVSEGVNQLESRDVIRRSGSSRVMTLQEAERIVINSFVDTVPSDTYQRVRGARFASPEVRTLISDLNKITGELIRQNNAGAHHLFQEENPTLKYRYTRRRNAIISGLWERFTGSFRPQAGAGQTSTGANGQPPNGQSIPKPALLTQGANGNGNGSSAPAPTPAPSNGGAGNGAKVPGFSFSTMTNGYHPVTLTTMAGIGGGVISLNGNGHMPSIEVYGGPVPNEPPGGIRSSQRTAQILESPTGRYSVTFLPTLEAAPYSPISAATVEVQGTGYRGQGTGDTGTATSFKAPRSRASVYSGLGGHAGGAIAGAGMAAATGLLTGQEVDIKTVGFGAGSGVLFPASENIGRALVRTEAANAARFALSQVQNADEAAMALRGLGRATLVGGARATGIFGAALDGGLTWYENMGNLSSENIHTKRRAQFDVAMSFVGGGVSAGSGIVVGGLVTVGGAGFSAPVGVAAGIGTTVVVNTGWKAGANALGNALFSEEEKKEERRLATRNLVNVSYHLASALRDSVESRRAGEIKDINAEIPKIDKNIAALTRLASHLDPILKKEAQLMNGRTIKIGASANREIAQLQQILISLRTYKGHVNGILDNATLSALSVMFKRKISQVTGATFLEINNVISSRVSQLRKQKSELLDHVQSASKQIDTVKTMRKVSRNFRSLKDVAAAKTDSLDVYFKDLRRFSVVSKEVLGVLRRNGTFMQALKDCGCMKNLAGIKTIDDLIKSLSEAKYEEVVKLALGRTLRSRGIRVEESWHIGGHEQFKIESITTKIAAALLR